jgi:hypothetical protein
MLICDYVSQCFNKLFGLESLKSERFVEDVLPKLDDDLPPRRDRKQSMPMERERKLYVAKEGSGKIYEPSSAAAPDHLKTKGVKEPTHMFGVDFDDDGEFREGQAQSYFETTPERFKNPDYQMHADRYRGIRHSSEDSLPLPDHLKTKDFKEPTPAFVVDFDDDDDGDFRGGQAQNYFETPSERFKNPDYQMHADRYRGIRHSSEDSLPDHMGTEAVKEPFQARI